MFIRSLGVTPFKQGANRKLVTGGFQITGVVTDSLSDGMFDPLAHPAVFKTEERAEAFLAKIKKNMGKVDLRNWLLTDHPCAAYQANPDTTPALFCPL